MEETEDLKHGGLKDVQVRIRARLEGAVRAITNSALAAARDRQRLKPFSFPQRFSASLKRCPDTNQILERMNRYATLAFSNARLALPTIWLAPVRE